MCATWEFDSSTENVHSNGHGTLRGQSPLRSQCTRFRSRGAVDARGWPSNIHRLCVCSFFQTNRHELLDDADKVLGRQELRNAGQYVDEKGRARVRALRTDIGKCRKECVNTKRFRKLISQPAVTGNAKHCSSSRNSLRRASAL